MDKFAVLFGGNWNNGSNSGSRSSNWSSDGQMRLNKRRRQLNAARSESVSNALVFNANLSCPVFGRKRFPIAGDDDATTLVAQLITPRSPAAVFWGVPKIIVDALYRSASIWWQAHVVDKRPERRGPAIAHSNTSRPVVFEKRIGRIGASLLHGLPAFVQRVVCFGRRVQLVSCRGRTGFCPEAAAGANIPVQQVSRRDCFLGAAIAFANVLRTVVFRLPFGCDKKPSKTLPDKVDLLWHWLPPLVKSRQSVTKNKLLRKNSVVRAKRKIKRYLTANDHESLDRFIASWRGHAAHADTCNLFNHLENRYGIHCHQHP